MKTTFSSNNLRKYRRARGFTQTQVARILCLHDHNRLSNWERGRCFPTVKTLFRLAAIYRTVPHALYMDVQRSVKEEIRQTESEILKTAEALQAKQERSAQSRGQDGASTVKVMNV
jgi:transcriptional regulator with XRE-family HTH domain